MQGIIGLIIEIIAGVVGGNAVGAAAKTYSLGPVGNSVAGGVGGLVLGQILVALGLGEPTMATEGAAAPTGAGPATRTLAAPSGPSKVQSSPVDQ